MSRTPVLSYRPPGDVTSRFVLAYAWIFAAIFVPIVVFTTLVVFVTPRFKQVLQDFRTTLPLLTRCVLALSSFVVDYWFIMIPCLALLMLALPLLPAWYAANGRDESDCRRRRRLVFWLALLTSMLLALVGALALLLPLIKLIQSVSGGGGGAGA